MCSVGRLIESVPTMNEIPYICLEVSENDPREATVKFLYTEWKDETVPEVVGDAIEILLNKFLGTPNTLKSRELINSKLKEKLKWLISMGVIKKNEFGEWCADENQRIN